MISVIWKNSVELKKKKRNFTENFCSLTDMICGMIKLTKQLKTDMIDFYSRKTEVNYEPSR